MISRAVRARLRHLLLDSRLARIDTVAREVEELRRERAEVARLVPTWDRIYVFDDTPDEGRLRAIDLALGPRQEVLRQLREEVTQDLESVGEEYPPFGIGVAIERAFRLAAGDLRPGPRWGEDRALLCELLSGIADRVARNWVPNLRPDALLAQLGEPERCQAAAASGPAVLEPHARLGTAPITHEALVPAVASRLLEGEFFASRAALAEAERVRDTAAREATRASDRVPLLERLNVFSEGPAQVALSERQEELAAAEQALRRAHERTRTLLFEALGAYPPLLVHQRALEARGVAALLRVERVSFMASGGQRRERELVVPRALVVAALRRLIEAFDEAFPGVPLPLSVVQERSAIGARVRSPREHLERAVFTALEAGWAEDLRQRALEHAALLGMTDRQLSQRSAGWLGWFGGSHPDLSERRAWHESAATDCWVQLLAHTRSQCETLAPLAARDLTLRASRFLTEVRTEPGEFMSPKDCALHGLPPLVSSLRAIKRALGSHYDLRGTRLELLDDVAAAEALASEALPSAPFEPLTREALVRRLSGWFPSDLPDRLRRLRQHAEAAGCGLEELWEPLCVGPRSEPCSLTKEGADALRRLDADLDAALAAAYPPGRIYFFLPRVLARVNAISARCEPQKVEIKGVLETRYACELRDQAPAVAALTALGALLHETYGELPDAHELLLSWERSAVVESSWLTE